MMKPPFMLLLPSMLIGTACSQSTPAAPPTSLVFIPAPCARNDTAYSPADTLKGVQPASARTIQIPPRDFRGPAHLRILVDARGRPEVDSTLVLSSLSPGQERIARQIPAQMTFMPAVFRGCAVRFWFEMTVTR